MRQSHGRRAISARFDDPSLVSCAGFVAVMALANRSFDAVGTARDRGAPVVAGLIVADGCGERAQGGQGL
jgi:hypothetical protein